MLVNKDTAVSTRNVLLVPYEPYHVPTYHSWMQDEELQELTASEPLSLEEEFAMQKSWRIDGDKLTFIICKPYPPEIVYMSFRRRSVVLNDNFNSVEQMIGDINLFLTQSDEAPEACIGELELMIAQEKNRGMGYGRNALLLFLNYLELNLNAILAEFKQSLAASKGGAPEGKMHLEKLRVQINHENKASMALFKSVGFSKVKKPHNYFGEVEMVRDGFQGQQYDGTWSYGPPTNELPFKRLKVEDNEMPSKSGNQEDAIAGVK